MGRAPDLRLCAGGMRIQNLATNLLELIGRVLFQQFDHVLAPGLGVVSTGRVVGLILDSIRHGVGALGVRQEQGFAGAIAIRVESALFLAVKGNLVFGFGGPLVLRLAPHDEVGPTFVRESASADTLGVAC